MLRKTTTRNVVTVYPAFIARYPAAEDLYHAREDELRDIIRPLGIADRARLLRSTAAALVERHSGQVPRRSRELLALPGVGKYTAAAVRCFAYGEREGLVDTNVVRVLGRVFSVSSARERPHTDPKLWEVANALVSRTKPRAYNQALLDLGGTVCTLGQPKCAECPLAFMCERFKRVGVAPEQ
jgi:A/G-specific adenine glycosylase